MTANNHQGAQTANQVVGKVVPCVLLGFLIYESYVVVGPLVVDHLLTNKQHYGQEQYSEATGIAIPIVYFVLLIFTVVSYIRILSVIWCDPGYVPDGYHPPEPEDTASSRSGQSIVATSTRGSCCASLAGVDMLQIRNEKDPWSLDLAGILEQRSPPPPGTEEFYSRDVFVCDPNGLPIWCGICCNWKPDRAHHCSNSGRCVRKMDHFCPWVGGVVGENSLKFFAQFTFYAAIFTSYTLVLLAYFLAENVAARSENRMVPLQVHYIVGLAIAAIFCLFSLGMVTMTHQMIFVNRTTIENQAAGTRRMFLAIALPPHMQSPSVTPPVQAHDGNLSSSQQPRPRGVRDMFEHTIIYPLHLPTDRPPIPAPQFREFAVVHTPEGMNPWDLGAKENWCAVMGRRPQDWLFPLRRSPNHDSADEVSEYPLGWQFTALLRELEFV